MTLKVGVRILGIRPELVLGLSIAQEVYRQHNVEFVITSVMEGTHKRASIHYAGGGADLRRPPLDNIADDIINDIKLALGEDFDVILEGDHIHMEFQPKSSY